MTKEQEEAIKLAENFTKMDFSNPMGWTGYYDTELKELSQAIETVLNKLKENSAEIQQKNTELAEKSAEIEKYKSLYNKALEDLVKADRENIENKKVIDLMAELIARKAGSRIEICHNMQCDKKVAKECKVCTKQYFERKAKDGRN